MSVTGEPPTVQAADSVPEMGVILMRGIKRIIVACEEDGRCFLVSELGTAGVRPATGAIKPQKLLELIVQAEESPLWGY